MQMFTHLLANNSIREMKSVLKTTAFTIALTFACVQKCAEYQQTYRVSVCVCARRVSPV